MFTADFEDNTLSLKAECKTLSKVWGTTVFVRSVFGQPAMLMVRHPNGLRDPLAKGKVGQLRALVAWEIARSYNPVVPYGA